MTKNTLTLTRVSSITRALTLVDGDNDVLLDILNGQISMDGTVGNLKDIQVNRTRDWVVKLSVIKEDGAASATVKLGYGKEDDLSDIVDYPQSRHGDDHTFGIVSGRVYPLDSHECEKLSYDATTGTAQLDVKNLDNSIVITGNNVERFQKITINATGVTDCVIAVTVLAINQNETKVV